MPNRDQLAEFTAWCAKHITGDEKGEAQIFLDRLFQGFGQPGSLDVGGHPEFRIRKDKEDGGGTAGVNFVWKPAQGSPRRAGRRVLTAASFSAKKDSLAQLLPGNQQVTARIEMGEPVTAPGVPKNYPDPKKLVTEDCLQSSS